ncbi:MAG: hypothetical protein AAGH15_24165, partial [Myxococcota bacterium]
EETLELLRSAPEGSREARLAGELGLRGDGQDRARLVRGVEDAIDGVRRWQSAMQGQTWSLTEFPRTLGAALVEMGRGRAPAPASAVWRAFAAEGHGEIAEALIEKGFMAAEAGVAALEVSHGVELFAEGAAAAGGLTIAGAVVLLAGGLALHALEEHEHDALFAVGRTLLGEAPEGP